MSYLHECWTTQDRTAWIEQRLSEGWQPVCRSDRATVVGWARDAAGAARVAGIDAPLPTDPAAIANPLDAAFGQLTDALPRPVETGRVNPWNVREVDGYYYERTERL